MYPSPYGYAGGGLYAATRRIYRRFPVAIPLLFVILCLLGTVMTSPLVVVGHFFLLPFAVCILFSLGGLLVLRSGIAIWRERRDPFVLVCPRCDLQSAWSEAPFRVTKFDDVEDAYVVCPSCGQDFHVPGDRKLI